MDIRVTWEARTPFLGLTPDSLNQQEGRAHSKVRLMPGPVNSVGAQGPACLL